MPHKLITLLMMNSYSVLDLSLLCHRASRWAGFLRDFGNQSASTCFNLWCTNLFGSDQQDLVNLEKVESSKNRVVDHISAGLLHAMEAYRKELEKRDYLY